MKRGQKIFERDNYKCRVCGSDGGRAGLVLAHIRHKCHAGDDRESNFITLCRKCYNNVPNEEIRNMFETEENKIAFDKAFKERVDSYSPYVKYIYSHIWDSSQKIQISRPRVNIFVKKNIKNDEDFEAIKRDLAEDKQSVRSAVACCITRKPYSYRECYESIHNSELEKQEQKYKVHEDNHCKEIGLTLTIEKTKDEIAALEDIKGIGFIFHAKGHTINLTPSDIESIIESKKATVSDLEHKLSEV
jgi:hypothetical protein